MRTRRIQRRRWAALRGAALALLSCVALALGALTVAGFGAVAPAGAATGGAGGEAEEAPATGNSPFDRHGMWIWYVSKSEGGSIPAIIRRAKATGIGTVYVKSADGSDVWSQFNRRFVRRLQRAGIDVCAWQFVYGDRPAAEAQAAAVSIARGADCFVIDAEGDYEGKYAAADLYTRKLRAAAGESYPIGLAGFPYVDYHPSYPYSVFMGPGGATFNTPQMYWKTIGTSVRAVFEHTYLYNRIWGHPIYPLGQTYEAPGNAQLMLFRRFAASYGGQAPNWWDWQETDNREWRALAARGATKPVAGYRPIAEHPLLKKGAKGDMVVWAQMHLVAAGQDVPITGIFGRMTLAAVRTFQEEKGMRPDGQIGTDTWKALLEHTPERVGWYRGAGASASNRAQPATRPLSASLPAKAYEIPPGPNR